MESKEFGSLGLNICVFYLVIVCLLYSNLITSN